MGMNWTDKQKKVIDLHNRNLLVAAAAGSGKTAVLVERVIQMITRREDPVDIDRLLIVTFTNAAAAEMRQRIGAALEKALEADPDNVHLQSQVTLLHNAQISTIHSFGLHVIRNHFYKIGLDPAFRIGDEREISLLKEDVLARVMEEAYEDPTQEFLDFVRAYGSAKSDRNICDMILSLYHYADSYPWPEEWLDNCNTMYQIDSVEEFDQLVWVQELVSYVQELTRGYKEKISYALTLANDPAGPELYREVLADNLTFLEDLENCSTYSGLLETFATMKFEAFSKKKQVCDKELMDTCKVLRKEVKDQLENLRKKYFAYPVAEQVEMIRYERPMMAELIRLTRRFMECFKKAKEEKNIIDFGDIEHDTLKILVDAGTKQPTATAREYQERFVEIMIDEYQDSNYVQEALLTSVSREEEGENNLFMVGDVKQSIYRFRLARPELFMDKYRRYTQEESSSQKIDLHDNFRSRPEVLRFTNDIFFHIMEEDMGNIKYDDAAALHLGNSFDQAGDPETYMTELLPIDAEHSSMDKVELEARIVATKIREMTEEATCGEYRPEYKDIVILVHAMKGWSDTFIRVFSQEGIPLISASRSGYFSAIEVQTVLQFLKILNNPRQDIPLAGVLKSEIGGFSSMELAQIKAAYPQQAFFEAVERWRRLDGAESARIVSEKIGDSSQVIAIYDKICDFYLRYETLRQQISDTPIHELLQKIYKDTGYLDYVSALPGGERRRANLDMLIELAISYENTSYQGLFDFVRYIEKMIRFELDYGEAELVSEQENAVRMMTIHKSKGLEFPVVFLCGMGKQFNQKSLNNTLVLHPQYGAGLTWMGKDKRVKRHALARQIFGLFEKKELLGEEQRLLYVALTRAKNKLVLTGIAKDKEKYQGAMLSEGEVLTFSDRMEAKCFWDWVLPVVSRSKVHCVIRGVDEDYIEESRKVLQLKTAVKRAELESLLSRVDQDVLDMLATDLNWKYPYADSAIIKQKVSVSELKHRYMQQRYLEQQDLEEATFLHREEEVIPYVPRFAERAEEENAGALRGTAMHRYLECFDFKALAQIRDGELVSLIHAQLEQMSETKRLSDDLRGRLNLKKLEGFLKTDEAQAMAQAAVRGDLYREKPFVMSIPATEVWPELKKEDGSTVQEQDVLVQGVVDVFWIDEEGITLLDYKTDAVKEPQELVRRYQLQLELYARALSGAFDNCPVKDILIYSFRLDSMVSLKK